MAVAAVTSGGAVAVILASFFATSTSKTSTSSVLECSPVAENPFTLFFFVRATFPELLEKFFEALIFAAEGGPDEVEEEDAVKEAAWEVEFSALAPDSFNFDLQRNLGELSSSLPKENILLLKQAVR